MTTQLIVYSVTIIVAAEEANHNIEEVDIALGYAFENQNLRESIESALPEYASLYHIHNTDGCEAVEPH